MKMKQNQTFLHGTYSNLVSCIFLWKILKNFNDFQTQNFSVLWLNGAQAIEIKKEWDIFPWDMVKSDVIHFLIIWKKYFNDFQNQNFSVLWLKGTRTIKNEIKSDIFSWDIFKLDVIFHWSQNTKILQLLS